MDLAKNSSLSSVMPSQGFKRTTALSPVLVSAANEQLSRHPKILQRDPREDNAGVRKLLLDALLLLLLGLELGCLGGGHIGADPMLEP